MTWLGFAGIFAAFFATHSVPLRPSVKNRLIEAIGRQGFALGYSGLSLAMLWLLIRAAGEAPYVMLWPTLPWHYSAVHFGMLAVCVILGLSIGRPNPFSFGGARNSEFDPGHPGIVRYSRHPVLVALALWAGLHVLPNGDLAHVLLFGTLGAFAVAGRVLVDRRRRREMGVEKWSMLWNGVRKAPLVHAPESLSRFAIRLLSGLVLYGVLVGLHPLLLGQAVR